MERNLYTYWIGKNFKLINVLKKLMILHSKNGNQYKFHLITPENINSYVKNIPDYFYELLPAHQADFVRINVICDNGGLWLDSDVLVIDSLDSIFDTIEKNDGFFIKQNNEVLCNGVFGSKKNTDLMIDWKFKSLEILNAKKNKIYWEEIGSSLLQNIFKNNNSVFANYEIYNGLDNLYPVNWDNCVTEYLIKPYSNHKNLIRENQPLIVLVNSVYKEMESVGEYDIIKGNRPINYFISKSIKNLGLTENEFIFESINDIGINSFFDKIFYINLDKDIERNEKIIQELKKYNITNYERIPGTLLETIPDKYYWRNFNLKKLNNKYIKGSLGCRNSHWRIMEICMERNYQRVLILEDDIIFKEDPNVILQNNLENLENWDMLYLGGTEENNFGGQIVGAFAYGVNRKIIEEIYYMLPTSGMEVDNFYAKVLYHMSYNYSPTGRYLIKKLEPFNSVIVNYNYQSNIR